MKDPTIEVRHLPRILRAFLTLGISLISVVVTCLALEVTFRMLLDDDTQKQLPYFGISEEFQSRLAWLNWESQRDLYGTTSYPASFDLPDKTLGWKVRPNAKVKHVKPGVYETRVTTNEYGLRGLDPAEVIKADDRIRIGVLGDSQTFGETVDDGETYVALLRKSLKMAEVLNFGVRGYGTDQMLLYYETVGRGFDLDVVILGFAFYHIRRNATSFLFYAKPYFTLSSDGALERKGVPVPVAAELKVETLAAKEKLILDQSVLLRWSWQRIRNLREGWLFSEHGSAWKLTKALIARFVESARAEGTVVILVNIDDSVPTLEEDLKRLADSLSVRLIDLGPRLRQARVGGLVYTLPNDNHWNAAGHDFVAKSLETYLCRQLSELNCASE